LNNHSSYQTLKYAGITYILCKEICCPEDGNTTEEVISKGVKEGWLVEVQSSPTTTIEEGKE